MKQRLKELDKGKSSNGYFTEYNSGQVETLLRKFLDDNHIIGAGNWSVKRNGWVIECPGESCHEHEARRDDCTLYYVKKSNGFCYITARCRHNSCGSSLVDYCKGLNAEWGKYLNQHYVK